MKAAAAKKTAGKNRVNSNEGAIKSKLWMEVDEDEGKVVDFFHSISFIFCSDAEKKNNYCSTYAAADVKSFSWVNERNKTKCKQATAQRLHGRRSEMKNPTLITIHLCNHIGLQCEFFRSVSHVCVCVSVYRKRNDYAKCGWIYITLIDASLVWLTLPVCKLVWWMLCNYELLLLYFD